MRARPTLALLLLALCVSPSRAQEAPPRPVDLSKKAADALESAKPEMDAAGKALLRHDWDEAIAAYRRTLTALGDDDALGGWRDQCHYNVACALARSGRAGRAAEEFAQSVRHGMRRIVASAAAGGFVSVEGLSLEHVLADTDLEPVRNERAYSEALRPYLQAGAAVVLAFGEAKGAKLPAVIVLAADGEDAERALPAWRVAARGRDVVLAALAGPVRPTPDARDWTLRDGDERWAVAKVREVRDRLAQEVRVDSSRIFVAGVGAIPGEVAWAAALAQPSDFAGFAAPGARFRPHWHADAIAAAPLSWRVALAAADETPAKMLKDRGIGAARIETSKDDSQTAAAVLDAILGRP